MRRRCIPLVEGGRVVAYVHTARPITPADRAAVDRFRQILTDAYQEEHDMTQPGQTQKPEPAEVDLKAAGVDGWFFVLEQAKQQKAVLEETIANAEEKIKAALGDRVDGVIDGRPVVRWLHTAAPRQFDKKALTRDHPDIAAKYTTFGEPGRRFELVKPKGGQS